MKSMFSVLLSLAMLTLVGCSGDSASPTGDDASENGASGTPVEVASPPTATAGTPGGNAGASTLPRNSAGSRGTSPTASTAPMAFTPVDDSAEASVRAVIEGISSGHPEIIWAAMPASYQSDINEIVRTFGSNMDPNLWQQILAVVTKVHNIVDSKGEFIANVPELKAQPNAESMKAAIPRIAGMLETLVEAADLQTLQSFDGGQFLAGHGASLLAHSDAMAQLAPDNISLAELGKSTVETISSDGDSATLKLTNPKGESQEMDWVRVDGRWIPADMAGEWDTRMAEAKSGLANLPQMTREAAPQMAMVSAMIGGVLAPLEMAEDQEQFNMAVQSLMGQAMGMMMGGPGGGGGGFPLGGPGGFSPGDDGSSDPGSDASSPDIETGSE